jgi:hypothetical protein
VSWDETLAQWIKCFKTVFLDYLFQQPVKLARRKLLASLAFPTLETEGQGMGDGLAEADGV